MRILIVRLSSLGDVVMNMAVLQFIKKEIPNAQIEWLVDKRFADVLTSNPDLSAVHGVPLRDCKKKPLKLVFEVLKLKKRLGAFDVVIDMQGLIKSSVVSRVLSKNVVGFDAQSAKEGLGALLYRYKVKSAYSQHILRRNFSLIEEALKIKVSDQEIYNKKPFLFYTEPKEDYSAYFSKSKKNVLVVLGGSWSSKVYPKELILEVVKQLDQNILLLSGNSEEHERAKWIAERVGHAKVLPKMSLNDVKAVIDRSDLVVGNDTGPCHMAWGLSKPSVTILGCTSITRIPINAKNLVVTSNACVNPSKIDKSDLSIQDIPPAEVVDAVKSLL